MNKRLFILSFLLTPLLTSCVKQAVIVEKPFFSFSTIFNITMYNEDEKETLKGVSLINKYNSLFDAFNSYQGVNNVYTINHTNDEVVIDASLYEALKIATSYYRDTKGYFNPFLGELSFAYKEAFDKYNEDKILTLPSESYINQCLQNIDEFELIFNDEKNSVQRKGNAQIDLGAFGKGYAIKKVKELFNLNNYKYYFINGGNSSTYFTSKPDGSNFKASIKYLKNKYLEIKNSSIGISSIFEQNIVIDGKNYSHIVNPFNGLNESYYDFTIVKHEDPTLTDVFSTALMVINDKKIIDELSQKFNFDYLIFKDNKEIYSKNIELKNI